MERTPEQQAEIDRQARERAARPSVSSEFTPTAAEQQAALDRQTRERNTTAPAPVPAPSNAERRDREREEQSRQHGGAELTEGARKERDDKLRAKHAKEELAELQSGGGVAANPAPALADVTPPQVNHPHVDPDKVNPANVRAHLDAHNPSMAAETLADETEKAVEIEKARVAGAGNPSDAWPDNRAGRTIRPDRR